MKKNKPQILQGLAGDIEKELAKLSKLTDKIQYTQRRSATETIFNNMEFICSRHREICDLVESAGDRNRITNNLTTAYRLRVSPILLAILKAQSVKMA